MLFRLDIQASRPGQPPAGADPGTYRQACSVWALDTTDQPVSIVIGPNSPAGSGFGLAQATVVALTVVCGAIALVVLGSRIRR
jgi:hypothetical protein